MNKCLSRRCAAEFVGAFAIVFFGCGAMVSLHGQPGSHLAVNIVFGLTVAALIYAVGHISGAHFNPAVSIGFASAKRFPWSEVPFYIGCQVAGAITASSLHRLFLAKDAQTALYGATIPRLSHPAALLVEVILTFFLMLVIISVATDDRVSRAVPGAAIGMTVLLCGLFAGPLTASSMNPARSIGPALFSQGAAFNPLWLYLVGPVIGAIAAALFYEWLRDPADEKQLAAV